MGGRARRNCLSAGSARWGSLLRGPGVWLRDGRAGWKVSIQCALPGHLNERECVAEVGW
jgi:hypothetical protein